MKTLRIILNDQLSATLPTLMGVNERDDVILMGEFHDDWLSTAHHKKKIAFLWAAARHFAEELRQNGLTVRYCAADGEHGTNNLVSAIEQAIAAHAPDRVMITEPNDYAVAQAVAEWSAVGSIPLIVLADDRFVCSRSAFAAWAAGKKQLRMEYFYREQRRKTGLLLEPDGTPTGGAWNYDSDNRRPPGVGLTGPRRLSHPKSATTRAVLRVVATRFPGHFGALEPFHFAVTRQQALAELDDFIVNLLPRYGTYQDAMVTGEPYLYHSLLSSYLNAGLLLPLEMCQRAEAAYGRGDAPLNAVEGFIRQIIGWREYVRGIYHHHMPAYGQLNYFNADRPLPALYWGAATSLFCVAEVVRHTHTHAYSHHIQRLMITGNLALLAGIDPKAVQEWYLGVYADAFEWVEMPNTVGMALFADGGMMASKPYAASGKYINRMSTFCQSCAYDPEQSLGTTACPFNALYWDFLARHSDKLSGNPRMTMIYANWRKMGADKQAALRDKAAETLSRLESGQL